MRLTVDAVHSIGSAAGDWSTVTFRDACDMMTGNYGSASYQQDEDGAAMVQFFIEETYSGKIAESFSFRNRAKPGTTHVYVYECARTVHMSTSMQCTHGSPLA